MLDIPLLADCKNHFGAGPLWDIEEPRLPSMDRPIKGIPQKEPVAGGLFAVHGLSVKGLAEPRFAG